MKNAAMKALVMITMTLATAMTYAQTADSAKPASAAQAPASKAHVLKRDELDKLLADPSKVLLIDVRRPDELTTVGGFPVYLSIQLKDLENSLAWIPKDRKIVTISNHAGRAGRAADLLSSKGFKVAGAAGAQSYEQEGGVLTKIQPPPPKTADAKTGG